MPRRNPEPGRDGSRMARSGCGDRQPTISLRKTDERLARAGEDLSSTGSIQGPVGWFFGPRLLLVRKGKGGGSERAREARGPGRHEFHFVEALTELCLIGSLISS